MSEFDNRLPKHLILKKRIEIREIFDKGDFERRKYVFIYKLPSESEMIGFFVNKRCGNAVKRNKVKRWMREIYRQNKSHFKGYKVILYTKRPLSYGYNELYDDIIGRPI